MSNVLEEIVPAKGTLKKRKCCEFVCYPHTCGLEIKVRLRNKGDKNPPPHNSKIAKLKAKGLNSLEIAERLKMSLSEVNKNW